MGLYDGKALSPIVALDIFAPSMSILALPNGRILKSLKPLFTAFVLVGVLAGLSACDHDTERLYQLGRWYYQKGLIDDAIIQFKAVTRKDPNFADAHHFLALAYMKKGWYDYAVIEAQRAFDLRPTSEIYELLQLAKEKAAEGDVDLP